MSAVRYVTDEASYDALLAADTPVLVDFTASWCGPCKQLAPVLEELQRELDSRVTVVKVDVDEAKDIAGRYTLQGVPTLMLFDGGDLRTTLVGARPKRELLSALEPLLA